MADTGTFANNDSVLIRMYNVGFGDCFLLVFPAPDRPRKVLIDCGVHFSGHNPDPTFNDVVDRLIEDIKDDDGVSRLDILIATHRHQDHVSGFEKPIWQDVEVGEVWMPWTEDYENEQAREILLKQSKKAKKLHALLTAMLQNPLRFGLEHADNIKEIENLKDFSENSLTNTKAMETLHHGFKNGDKIPRQYLPYKDRALNTIKPAALPGVTVYIMGPSFDKEVIRDMDPPAAEQWFKMMEDKGKDDCRPILPFHEDWSKKPDEVELVDRLLSKRDRRTINRIGDDNEFSVAKSLEDSVNGTSLMMMFQIGKAYLFFPGDAQNGTWQSALKDDEWRELLTRTNFYKVGHHGSHNATPKEFVHHVLQPNCKAMVSVYPVPAFSEIPKKELLDDLVKLPVDYARSDKAGQAGDPATFARTNHYVETTILT